MSRSELDLAVSVRKATSPEETAPKRKHVRSCIVYSWDHKSSGAFWQALKIQPLLSDEVQTFKALICIHKMLQEGHPNCLREAQTQVSWIDSLGRAAPGDGLRGYGILIREYSSFLLAKLKFHRQHPEFNGTLEYEEYVTLKATLDPNEGYETTSNLMALQDQINSFQKLIFSHFRHGITNECKISSLVPLVQESYGIYRFITSMLRAMFQANELVEVLEPLEKRYIAQFHRLTSFYYECSNLNYLSRLITLPKLPERPIDLRKQQDNVYLGLQPVEKQEQIEENETSGADNSNLFQTNNLESGDLQQFWETPFTAENDSKTQQFEVLPEIGFLALEQNSDAAIYNPASQSHFPTTSIQVPFEAVNVIHTYENRIGELENTINHMQNTVAASSSSVQANLDQATIRSEMWANKYENLAQLYTRLRKEHLATIERAKELDMRLKDFTTVTQRCKALQKAVQEKSVLLLTSEREKDNALAKLKHLEESPSLLKNNETQLVTTSSDFDSQLQEKEEEIAIMKEAFEQSLGQLDETTREKSKIKVEVLKTIETVMRTCAMHIKEARVQMSVLLSGAKLESPKFLSQILEECTILLAHLPEFLRGVNYHLIAESSLELSHGIVFVIMYSNVFVNQLVGGEKSRLEAIVGEISTMTETLFNGLSKSLSESYPPPIKTEYEGLADLQKALSLLSSFIENVGFSTFSTDLVQNKQIKEDLQTALERAASAKLSAERLQDNLANAQYSSFEIGLSSNIVHIAMDITKSVANLLDKAAKTEEQIHVGEDPKHQKSQAYQSASNWSNGFISASKAVAGAISVLITVADGVLRDENDIEQLEVATQNVISATTQLIVAARVKLSTVAPLRVELEKAAASVISSCRLLTSQIRDRLESSEATKGSISLSPYELKVAEMDQQVRIVQLETALQSARLKLGELRKLSYAIAGTD